MQVQYKVLLTSRLAGVLNQRALWKGDGLGKDVTKRDAQWKALCVHGKSSVW